MMARSKHCFQNITEKNDMHQIKIFALINGNKHEKSIPLEELLYWAPEPTPLGKFKELDRIQQAILLRDCSEEYWLQTLQIRFGASGKTVVGDSQ